MSSANKSRQLVFIDVSGSTKGKEGYWKCVKEQVKKLKHDAVMYSFNDKALQRTRNNMLLNADIMHGAGGTLISQVVPFVEENDDILLITDGEVSAHEVQLSDQLIGNKTFNQVSIFVINTTYYGGGGESVSVAVPFMRKAKHYTLNVNGNVVSQGSSTDTVDLKKYYDDPDLFLNELDTLHRLVFLQNIGRNNMELRTALLDLQKNLVHTLAKRRSSETEGKLEELRRMISTDTSKAILLMRTFIGDVNVDPVGQRISDAIQKLINICSSNHDFSVDAFLRVPSRLDRATQIDAPLIEDLGTNESFTSAFECPISLDDALPVCLVAAGDPVLKDMEKHTLDEVMTNPLALLLNDEHVRRLVGRLDHLIGLEAAQALFGRGQVISPLTRRPVSSAISIGKGNDHIQSTNMALSDLLFGGGKLVGNANMWFAVLYFAIVHYSPRLSAQTEFMNGLRTQLCHRFRTRTSYLTLSGLATSGPMLLVPMDIAVWYCALSPFITENTKSPGNRLRDFGSTGQFLLDLLGLLELPYPRADLLAWMARYRAFAWMMNQAKQNTREFYKMMRAQCQNSMRLNDGTLIMLDGPATDLTRPSFPSFAIREGSTPTLEELVELGRWYVNVAAKTNDVYIPQHIKLDTKHAFPVKRNYSYTDMDHPNTIKVAIDPTIMRPFKLDPSTGRPWVVCAMEMFGGRYLSMYNYYAAFVDTYKRFPLTQDEYIAYMADRQINRENPVDTLPQWIRSYTQDVWDSYKPFVVDQNMTPEEFIKRSSPMATIKNFKKPQ